MGLTQSPSESAANAVLENWNHEEVEIISGSQRRHHLRRVGVADWSVPIHVWRSCRPLESAGHYKETGKPIEGAVVFVRWEKRYTSFVGEMGGNEYYDSEEALTNADGRFVIGARQTWTLNPLSEIYGPEFFIFKSGYGRWQFRDFDKWGKGDAIQVSDRVRAETRRFTAEGPVLELPPLKTKEERLNVSGDMPLRVPAGRMPKYLEEIDRNRQSRGLQLIDRRE